MNFVRDLFENVLEVVFEEVMCVDELSSDFRVQKFFEKGVIADGHYRHPPSSSDPTNDS